MELRFPSKVVTANFRHTKGDEQVSETTQHREGEEEALVER
jgi:hypothetical protein